MLAGQGGNFLHEMGMALQLRIYEMENRMGVPVCAPRLVPGPHQLQLPRLSFFFFDFFFLDFFFFFFRRPPLAVRRVITDVLYLQYIR